MRNLPGSAELRDIYEERYTSPAGDAERYGRWRALCAEGKADHVVQLVGALPERPSRVAEIGCGDGGLLSALAQRGVGETRTGFEISERAVALAAGRHGVSRAERFDGATLPVEDSSFDLGVLSHVIEHVPDPLPLLRESARACRALVVEAPLEDNRSASRPAAARSRAELGHLHRFSREDVRGLLAQAGLRVAAEVADPLPHALHAFWADRPAARARALAKASIRRGLFVALPDVAERTFTLHYAALGVRPPS